MQKLILLIIIPLFIGSPVLDLHAQKKNEEGFIKRKVPRHIQKDVVKLANYLTEGMQGDSMKVLALSSYLVTEIRYDFRRLKNGDWKTRDTKKMLKKKKALCGGYAKLMQELCLQAGINCEPVIGYTKTWNYQPYDSLIRAEHAWNVVQVNGNWRPIDLSWSTGYMKQKKQWIRKHLYWWFKIPYRTKYKWVNKLTFDYMFTPPKTFVQSHLPLQPYWQLLKTPVPVEVFELDTINTYLNSSYKKPSINFNYEIQRYRGLPQKDKYLKSAQQAFKFNGKNHRTMGFGYYNYTTELQNEIDPELPEELQIEKLDSCISLYEISINYYNEYLKDTQEEYRRRKRRNTRLKKYLLDENKTYINYNKQLIKDHKRTHYLARKDINIRSSKIRKYKLYSKKVQVSNIKKINRPTKQNGRHIARAKQYIVRLDDLDSVLALNNQIKLDTLMGLTHQQDQLVDDNYYQVLYGYELSRNIENAIWKLRWIYNDANSKWINPIKDSICETDLDNAEFNVILNTAYDSLAFLKDSLANFYDFTFTSKYMEQIDLLEDLKKSSIEDQNEEEDYKIVVDNVHANYDCMIAVYDSIVEIDAQRMKEMKVYMPYQKQSIKLFKKEIMREYRRYYHTQRWYSRNNAMYKRQARNLKREVSNRIRVTRQEIQELKRIIREKEQEEKRLSKLEHQ